MANSQEIKIGVLMNTLDDYMKDIAKKLEDVQYVYIDCRPIRESDLLKLSNNQILRINHPKGFLIEVRKSYIIDSFLNIPTLMYSYNQYIICDEWLGRHGVEYNAKDMAEYVNGLLGY
jgi:hypothetical protein